MQIKDEMTLGDFQYMEQLELKYYSQEHVTPYREAYQWHLANPDTGHVLEDGGRIVAFTDILPVRQDIYEQIINGIFNDKYLTTEHLVSMEGLREGDSVNLLLSCVLVEEDYRKTDALKILLGASMEYYRGFVKKGITVDSIVTSNVTLAGERFSERMGFEKIGLSGHRTVLYRTTFREFDEKVQGMK
ncbi:MAG TPA: hypothetical protein VN381_03215 [Anaerovoracaceae bacterium]|nr:hypothetical protein [Anaerovoracaceae bacterium]